MSLVRKNRTIACLRCRESKTKCTGEPICHRCHKFRFKCVFPVANKKRGPQQRYGMFLESRVTCHTKIPAERIVNKLPTVFKILQYNSKSDHMITSSDKIPFYQPFYDLPSINQPKPSASWNERMVSNEIQKYCNHKPNQTCMKCNVANGLNMLGYSDCPQVQFANPNCKKTFLNSLELFPKKNSFLENPNIHPKISSIFEKGSQSGIFEEFVTLPLLDLNYPLYPSISALAMNQFPLVVPLSSSSIFDGKISKGNSDTTLKSDYFEDHSLS